MSRMNGTPEDYRQAPSGNGPHASEWANKPHRLVYDLAAEIKHLHRDREALIAENEKLRQQIEIRRQAPPLGQAPRIDAEQLKALDERFLVEMLPDVIRELRRDMAERGQPHIVQGLPLAGVLGQVLDSFAIRNHRHDALTASLARLEAENERLKAESVEPNVWVCQTCGFEAHKMVLRAFDGAVGINSTEQQDICPNDGTSMRRRTWKEACDQAVQNAVAAFERAETAEQRVSSLTARTRHYVGGV